MAPWRLQDGSARRAAGADRSCVRHASRIEPEGAATELLDRRGRDAGVRGLGDASIACAGLALDRLRAGRTSDGDHAAWEEAEERALALLPTDGLPTATCLGQIAAALYWGPTPVPTAIERCEELLDDDALGDLRAGDRRPFLGGLHAQRGDFDARARAAHRRGASTLTTSSASNGRGRRHCGDRAGGRRAPGRRPRRRRSDAAGAVRVLERAQAYSISRRPGGQARRSALPPRRVDEAEQWAAFPRTNAASDDSSASCSLDAGRGEASCATRRVVRALASSPTRPCGSQMAPTG